MRKLFRTLCVLGGGILLAGNLAGCSSDNTNDSPSPISATITNEPAAATSVKLKLTTSGVSEYAWQVSPGNVTTAPKAEFIFSDGRENGQFGAAKDGDNIIEVKGLEGNKEYTIFVATKSSEGYDVKDVHITTKDYTQTVTIVDIKQFSMSFHVKIAAGKYFKWAIYQKDNYDSYKEGFGWIDYDLLDKSGSEILSGEQTVTVIDGKMPDGSNPENEDDMYLVFKVGAPYVLLLGECDAEGNLLCDVDAGGGGMDPLSSLSTRSAYPDSCIGEYTEVCTDEIGVWTGAYAKYNLWAAPATPGPKEVTVEMTEKTAKHVTFHLTPTSDMIGFTSSIYPVSEWESMVELYGETGAQFMMTQYGGGLETGEINVVADNLVVGEKYILAVLSTFSQDYSIQTFQKIPFEAKNSTQALAEVVVTGINAPADAGDKTGPYHVWFNVKAPNKDVGSAKYSCEYTKNWIATINGGTTSVDALLKQYGVLLSSGDIDKINSDAGLNLSFDSWENTESRLYILAYNTDEVAKITFGASTSPEEPAMPKVESSLFTDLIGDWTATYKSNLAKNGAKVKVTIAAGPEYPTGAIPDDVKNNLVTYYMAIKGLSKADAEKLVAQEYKNYQDRAKRFGEKYREQNRLVCRGLEYADPAGSSFDRYYKLGYFSPWDLFCNLEYSVYSTDDLFYDYGSKWFLEIGKDGANDIIKVATNPTYVAPLQFMAKEYHLGHMITGNFYSYQTCDYPVTVSADKQTITINAYPGEKALFPAIISVNAQTGVISNTATYSEAIVLTKGWTAPAGVASLKSLNQADMPKVENGVNNHYRRTKLFVGTPSRTVTLSPITKLPVNEKVARMAELKKNNR